MPNPMDAPVIDAPMVDTPAQVEPSAPADPFALDEARVASLSPEQRAAIEPVIEEWRGKAKAELEKTGKTYEEKYKLHLEKSQTLDELVKDPRFKTWWTSTQQQVSAVNPAAAATRPADFASEQEWQTAWANAYAGDYTKFKEIQARMFAMMASPVVQQLREGQQELKATLEMKDLFERHADAKDLDLIGRNPADPNDKSESLLEMCLNWADQNGKTLEEGYAKARSWSNALKAGAQQQAMGLVQGKKQSITSGPSTNKETSPVIEVADADELMARNMDYLASGQKPPKFVIRKQEAPTSANRWSQRN